MPYLPKQTITDDQRDWVEREKARMGGTMSDVIRRILQNEVDKEKRKRK